MGNSARVRRENGTQPATNRERQFANFSFNRFDVSTEQIKSDPVIVFFNLGTLAMLIIWGFIHNHQLAAIEHRLQIVEHQIQNVEDKADESKRKWAWFEQTLDMNLLREITNVPGRVVTVVTNVPFVVTNGQPEWSFIFSNRLDGIRGPVEVMRFVGDKITGRYSIDYSTNYADSNHTAAP